MGSKSDPVRVDGAMSREEITDAVTQAFVGGDEKVDVVFKVEDPQTDAEHQRIKAIAEIDNIRRWVAWLHNCGVEGLIATIQLLDAAPQCDPRRFFRQAREAFLIVYSRIMTAEQRESLIHSQNCETARSLHSWLLYQQWAMGDKAGAKAGRMRQYVCWLDHAGPLRYYVHTSEGTHRAVDLFVQWLFNDKSTPRRADVFKTVVTCEEIPEIEPYPQERVYNPAKVCARAQYLYTHLADKYVVELMPTRTA